MSHAIKTQNLLETVKEVSMLVMICQNAAILEDIGTSENARIAVGIVKILGTDFETCGNAGINGDCDSP